jgi:zinc protease
LNDVVRNPAFAAEEIERQREQALSALQVNSRDPGLHRRRRLQPAVYGFHPYGLPMAVAPRMPIAQITRADLLEFHRRYFAPNNMVLAVVGDVTSDEAFSTVQRVFGNWARAMSRRCGRSSRQCLRGG